MTLSFPDFISTHQIPVYSINFFVRFSQFWSLAIRVAQLFMTMPTPIFSHQLLILVNLYQHAKNQACSFYSRDILDLKILHFDWPSAFWAMSQELEFSQIDFSKHTIININFHYKPN